MLLLCSTLATACGESSFTGGSQKPAERIAAPTPSTPSSGDLNKNKTPASTPASGVTPGATVFDDSGHSCLTSILPVNVMIVLDVSSSMSPQIEAVKTSLKSFVSSVRTIKPSGSQTPLSSVNVGLVTFVDSQSQQRTYDLTGDAAVLNNNLNAVQLQDDPANIDYPEGGLLAVKTALDMLARASGNTATIPIVLFISDDYAHDGSGSAGSRNFSRAGLEAQISSSTFDHILLYDSVPTTSTPHDTFESGASSPAEQWSLLRQSWVTTRPAASAQPGSNIGFPLQSNTLLSTLPDAIGSYLKVCN